MSGLEGTRDAGSKAHMSAPGGAESAPSRAPKKPPSPEQRARYGLTEARRKQRAQFTAQVEDIADRLEMMHTHPLAWWHHARLPLMADSLFRGTVRKPALLDTLETLERFAAEGDIKAAECAATHGQLARLCDELRHVRPPPRDAERAEDAFALMRQHRKYAFAGKRHEDDPEES